MRDLGFEIQDSATFTVTSAGTYDSSARIVDFGANAKMHGEMVVDVTEIEAGLIYQDENVKVTAFAVKHGNWENAFGYRFETADKTIVISGDTAPSESIVEMCNGCDILVHEVYSNKGYATRPPVWQAYHADFHTSAKQLAELASRAKPGERDVGRCTGRQCWGRCRDVSGS